MNLSAIKILLIDDSTFSRNLLKRTLGDKYQYLEAADGMMGIDLFTVAKPDLIFLDLTMPGVSGMEVLQTLQKIDQNARVIIASANVQSLTHQEVMAMGASGFVPKPFTPESVQPIVQLLLQEAL